MRRFNSAERLCPICAGWDGLPRGQGRRCYGFISSDGRFVRCSREECARALEPEATTGLYVHYLGGDCLCGTRHGERRVEPFAARPRENEIGLALRNQKKALWIWNNSKSIAATLAEINLRRRAITLVPGPEQLRFHPSLFHSPTRTHLPAIVAPFRDAKAEIIAILRIFLKPDGSAKADVPKPKMMLAPTKGAAIRFGEGPEIIVTEGIENALSVLQAVGIPTWAAGSAAGIRLLQLPPHVRRVTIFADADDHGEGIAAANEAARHWCREGRDARVAAVAGADANDLLRR